MDQPEPIDINILPERYRPARINSYLSIGILVGVALLFGLMPAYALLTRERNQTAALDIRLQRVMSDLTMAQGSQDELADIDRQIEQAEQQLAQLEAQLDTLGRGKVYRSQAFAAIINSVAEDVRVTSVRQAGDTFTVSGVASGEVSVLNYAQVLQNRVLESGVGFANVRVVLIRDEDDQTSRVEFSIEVEQ